MDKFLFNEIIRGVPQDEELKLNGYTLPLIGKYARISVQLLDEGHMYYHVNKKELLESDIQADELMELRTQGWELSEDEESVIKKII